jgi:F0F1-type ATP synthase assembly protein I
MAKKKSKKVKHQSFKLSPHPYSNQQVFFFVLAAVVVGLVLGWLLKDQTAAVLGISTY